MMNYAIEKIGHLSILSKIFSTSSRGQQTKNLPRAKLITARMGYLTRLKGWEYTWLILYLSCHLQWNTALPAAQHTLAVPVLALSHVALVSKGADVLLLTNTKHSSIRAAGLQNRVQISVPSHPSIPLPFTVELNLPFSYSPH